MLPDSTELQQMVNQAVEQLIAERAFFVRGEYMNPTMVFPYLVSPGDERTAEQFNQNFAALAAWMDLMIRGAVAKIREDLGLPPEEPTESPDPLRGSE